MNKNCLLIIMLLISGSINAQPIQREMRGAWIATVKNIDWPQSRTQPADKQKEDLINIINEYHQNGLNAVFMQIRAASDAYYNSPIEPWSEWMTGKQGQRPSPYYDPLQTAIDECHKNAMEFHAWFNPYRAVSNVNTSSIADNHVSKVHPEWCLRYGDDLWLDPGLPEVRNYIVKIVMDVVRRYDINGVHFDDYFYPYPIAGKDFPDSASYARYNDPLRPLNRADWRRKNVDLVIEQLHDSIKAVKPYIKFGIAPFGIWRNKTSDPRGSESRGLENYDALYADVLLWLEKGWIDYAAPQLYWYIGYQHANFEVLIQWWKKNLYGKQLYIGHAVYMSTTDNTNEEWRKPTQIPSQLRLVRKFAADGSILYNTTSFRKNANGVRDSIKSDFYAKLAFPPAMNWIDNKAPNRLNRIDVLKYRKEYFMLWQQNTPGGAMDTASYYLIFSVKGAVDKIEPNLENLVTITKEPLFAVNRRRFALFRKKVSYSIVAMDRMYNMSLPSDPVLLKL